MNILKFVKDEMKINVKIDGDKMFVSGEHIAREMYSRTRVKNNKEYTEIRWDKLSEDIDSIGFPNYLGKDKITELWIEEGYFYKLMMYFRGDNKNTQKFQDWLSFEVIPSIRKNNFHINEKDMTNEQYDELVKRLSAMQWFYGLSKNKEFSINVISEKMFGNKNDLWNLFIKYGFLDQDRKVIRKQAKSKELDDKGNNIMKDIFYLVPRTTKNSVGNQNECEFRVKLSAFGIMMAKHLSGLDKGL